MRKGWLIRRKLPSGGCGYGEICPLPTHQGELATDIGEEDSAFARWSVEVTNPTAVYSAMSAALLPLDRETGNKIAELDAAGYRFCKLKLGVQDKEREWQLLEQVCLSLPQSMRLRLDPNASWSAADWAFWKPRLESKSDRIEFIEEPFEPGISAEEFAYRASETSIPIALDESLQENLELWTERDWGGFWVIKPSLFEDPDHWLPKLEGKHDRIILSAAFETAIGMNAILRLASMLPKSTHHGLGTQAWFADEWGVPQNGPRIESAPHSRLEALWNTIPE